MAPLTDGRLILLHASKPSSVAGDPARKSKNMSVTFDNISNYYCEGPISGRKSYKSEGFPKERCNTLIMKIFTPSCHNGQKYNPADPHAHMRFPEWV